MSADLPQTQKNDELIAEMNIIPFVDIVLVLLIIFMAAAPRLVQKGFSIKLPQLASVETVKPEKFAISIHHTGDIFFNKQLISLDQLAFHSRKAAENQAIKAVISADISVSHGRVMEIIQTIKASGIENFIFTADQK